MSWVAVGVGIAAVGTAYSIKSSEDAKKRILNQENDAKKEASRIQAEEDQKEAASNELAIQQKARARQKLLPQVGTILGGGVGSYSGGPGPGGSQTSKTILGS